MERGADANQGSGLSAGGTEAQAARQLDADRGRFGASLYDATPRVWVMQALVALNVLVFLAMLADGAGLLEANSAVHLRWGANFGPLTKEDQWWRLATCVFLHFGLVHLAMNMWALWGVGGLVERLYGNAGFLALYLFAGLTGSFASLYWNADRVVSAGASGAIFGVFGALAAFVLREPRSVPKSVLKSLTGSMLVFIVYSVVFGAAVSGIDNAAHAGGLAGGFLAGLLLSRPLGPRPALSGARLTAALAAAMLTLGTLFVLTPPPAYSYAAQQTAAAAMKSFALEEERLAAKANELFEARKAGRLDDRQLGEKIEAGLLPGWNAAHARFAAITLEEPAPAARQLRIVTEYVRLRRDMFAAYAAGLKTGEAARVRRAEALAAEAQRLMKEMRERAR